MAWGVGERGQRDIKEVYKMKRQDNLSAAQGIITALGLSFVAFIIVVLMIKVVRYFVRI